MIPCMQTSMETRQSEIKEMQELIMFSREKNIWPENKINLFFYSKIVFSFCCCQVIGTACIHLKCATTQSMLSISSNPNRKCSQVQLQAKGPPSEQCAAFGSALRLSHRNSVHQSVEFCGQFIGTACSNRQCAAEQGSPLGIALQLGHHKSVHHSLEKLLIRHVPEHLLRQLPRNRQPEPYSKILNDKIPSF